MEFAEAYRKTSWPSLVFIGASLVTVPVYITLVIALLNGRRTNPRFRATYYNLVLTQALADAWAIPSDTFTFLCRYAGFFRDFFWDNRQILAPYSFNSNHLDLMLRVFGDCLVAVQRYLVLCHSNSPIQRVVSHLPFFLVILIHWVPPFIISIPITFNFDRTFDTPDTLLTVISASDQMLASSLEVIYQSITFMISSTAYFFVFRLILKVRSKKGFLTREMRLSLIVMGQFFGFTLALIFYITQFIVVRLALKEAIVKIRDYYPLLTGFESYINPWLHLILNNELRAEVLKLFCIRSTSSFSAVSSDARNLQNNRVGPTGTQ